MTKENLEEELIEEEINIEDTEEDDTKEIKESEKIEELENRLVRLQADFENYKKRAIKEKQDIVKYSLEDIIVDILPVIDSFNRALDIENTDNEEGIYEGLKMINSQLIETLEKKGLKEIDALNREFDPNYHNAISQEESEDKESNIVVKVYQAGYMLNDKVIRPSMVVVSK